MVVKGSSLTTKLFTISLFSLFLFLFIITSNFGPETPPTIIRYKENDPSELPPLLSLTEKMTRKQKKRSQPFDFLQNEFKGTEIKIGILKVREETKEEEEEELFIKEWNQLGHMSLIGFDRVPDRLRWEELFPEWIDEEEKWRSPSCPEIPMPRLEEYGEFDVVVTRTPCGAYIEKKGVRDVFRLQVHLIIANLAVRNHRKNDGRAVAPFVVFLGSCGPMHEIFRCQDLVKRGSDFWVYKPDLRRLKQKVNMPVGSCQLAPPLMNKGKEIIDYDLWALYNPIDHHPKEAYVTLLHSSEAYVCGAIVLAQSIIQTNSTKDLVLLADPSVSKKSRKALQKAGWEVRMIERIRSPYAKRNAYNEWNYSKLRIWQLTDYAKVIFIDSDFIVIKNIDGFFAHPQLSVVGNDGVLFNSGLMLIEPSQCVFEMLVEKKYELVSYNGGDQGFLNEVFTWWHRWPRGLNHMTVLNPAGGETLKLRDPYAVHYLGLKPWMCYREYDCNWDMEDHHAFASDYAHWRWWQVHDAMPEQLHAFCALSPSMDARIKKWRKRAKKANLIDGHWKIEVTDPRQLH